MTKKITPEKTTKVIAMRAAGYTVATIANTTGVSASSVKRICQKSAVEPGEALDTLVAQAKSDLVKSLTSDDALKRLAASFIQDTIIQAEAARDAAANAAKHLKASNLDESLKVMKGCNAWANTTKLTADALRSAVKIAPDNNDTDDLPELIITTLMEEDIEALRKQQREEAALLGIGPEELIHDDPA